jgi:hypothetical protein
VGKLSEEVVAYFKVIQRHFTAKIRNIANKRIAVTGRSTWIQTGYPLTASREVICVNKPGRAF